LDSKRKENPKSEERGGGGGEFTAPFFARSSNAKVVDSKAKKLLCTFSPSLSPSLFGRPVGYSLAGKVTCFFSYGHIKVLTLGFSCRWRFIIALPYFSGDREGLFLYIFYFKV